MYGAYLEVVHDRFHVVHVGGHLGQGASHSDNVALEGAAV
jgi:hypothetical protein